MALCSWVVDWRITNATLRALQCGLHVAHHIISMRSWVLTAEAALYAIHMATLLLLPHRSLWTSSRSRVVWALLAFAPPPNDAGAMLDLPLDLTHDGAAAPTPEVRENKVRKGYGLRGSLTSMMLYWVHWRLPASASRGQWTRDSVWVGVAQRNPNIAQNDRMSPRCMASRSPRRTAVAMPWHDWRGSCSVVGLAIANSILWRERRDTSALVKEQAAPLWDASRSCLIAFVRSWSSASSKPSK